RRSRRATRAAPAATWRDRRAAVPAARRCLLSKALRPAARQNRLQVVPCAIFAAAGRLRKTFLHALRDGLPVERVVARPLDGGSAVRDRRGGWGGSRKEYVRAHAAR